MKTKMNDKLSRRELLQTTGSMLPAGVLASSLLSEQTTFASDHTLPTRMLGKTAERISLLTLGTGSLRTSLGQTVETMEAIIDRALEWGINSIDTAPNYADAEELLGQALKSNRDKFFIATKTEAATYEGCWEQLRTSMERMQTDRLDLVYIHNWGVKDRFPDVKDCLGKQGTLGALREAQKLGMVRFIGVSGHLYPSRFHAVLARQEIDVVMNAVNFVAKHVYDFETKVLESARAKNIGTIAMKVLGGAANWQKGNARLAGEHYENAIRYALSIPGISSLNIGVRSIKELDQAAQTIIKCKPFSKKEQLALQEQGKKLADEWGAMFGKPVT